MKTGLSHVWELVTLAACRDADSCRQQVSRDVERHKFFLSSLTVSSLKPSKPKPFFKRGRRMSFSLPERQCAIHILPWQLLINSESMLSGHHNLIARKGERNTDTLRLSQAMWVGEVFTTIRINPAPVDLRMKSVLISLARNSDHRRTMVRTDGKGDRAQPDQAGEEPPRAGPVRIGKWTNQAHFET